MSKKITWLLISIIFILLVICGIIVFLLISNKKHNNLEEKIYIETLEPIKELKEVQSISLYYRVKGCINKYYTYCNLLKSSNETTNEETENIARNIYNMLDKEYIAYKNMSESNMLAQLEKIDDFVLHIDSMYYIEDDEFNNLCIVNGTLRDKETNNIAKFKVAVKFDYKNKTFSIIPNDYASQKYSNIMLGQKIDFGQVEIEKNDNNTYMARKVSEEDYVGDLFNDFKDKCMYDIDTLFERLDEEYKDIRIKNVTELEEYLKNRYANINSLQLLGYSIEKLDGYTQYIMVDSSFSQFIIRETATMKYTVIPDIYTVDLPDFRNNYDYTNEQGKIALNLDKIQNAINNHDYKYVYDKLSDGFKNIHFKTYEDFERYAKNNFYYKNKFEYTNFTKEGEEYYTYEIKITDRLGITDEAINKIFVMVLRR